MEKIKNILSKIKTFSLSHKILTVVFLVVVIILPFVIYHFVPKKATVTYITQVVRKGDINVAVSGSGQISSLKSSSVASKVSGEILGVYVKAGDTVSKGETIFKIDSTEQAANVKNAEIALEQVQVKLEDMTGPVDELTLLQAQDSLTNAQESETNAETSLKKAYDDGFNDVSSSFLDLPSVMTGLYNVLFGKTLSSNGSQQNIDYYTTTINYYEDPVGTTYRNDAYNKYITAKTAYDKTLNDYKTTTRYSSEAEIESLISETYDTVKSIAEAIKSANNLVEYYKYTLSNKQQTYNSGADVHVSTLSGYTSKANSSLSTLLSDTNSITSDKNSIVSAQRTIKEKQLSLKNVEDGYTDLEIRTQELAVAIAEQNLADAKTDYNNCWITAPYSGTISSVSAIVGDTANSGTTMGTIITNTMVAKVTLNEVDVANISIGQKVELTFDALDNVTVEGEVSEMDTVGTVSSGVVSYAVTISFETDNESVKPGMSVTANIITNSATGVITVPSSAVKTAGGKSYIEILTNGVPEKKTVEVGISDDTNTEIKSGLTEGEKVVTGTVSSTKKTTTSSSTKSTTTTTKSTTQTLNSLTDTGGGPTGGGPGM
jgi:RND family efflux transporter MFP subunit